MSHNLSSHLPTIVHQCPIEACPWTHTEQPTPDDITTWPGYGTMPLMDLPSHMTRHRMKEAETAALAHLEGHTPMEWAKEIMRLRSELNEAKSRTSFGGFDVVESADAPPGSITLVPAAVPPERQEPDEEYVAGRPAKGFAVVRWDEESDS